MRKPYTVITYKGGNYYRSVFDSADDGMALQVAKEACRIDGRSLLFVLRGDVEVARPSYWNKETSSDASATKSDKEANAVEARCDLRASSAASRASADCSATISHCRSTVSSSLTNPSSSSSVLGSMSSTINGGTGRGTHGGLGSTLATSPNASPIARDANAPTALARLRSFASSDSLPSLLLFLALAMCATSLLIVLLKTILT